MEESEDDVEEKQWIPRPQIGSYPSFNGSVTASFFYFNFNSNLKSNFPGFIPLPPTLTLLPLTLIPLHMMMHIITTAHTTPLIPLWPVLVS